MHPLPQRSAEKRGSVSELLSCVGNGRDEDGPSCYDTGAPLWQKGLAFWLAVFVAHF